MYLSLLELNPRSKQVQAELRDPYQMHRTISKAFGEEKDFKNARCLYRVDESSDGRLLALVQSKCCPKWDNLTTSDGYLAGELRVKEITPVVRTGQILSFRVRANPSVKTDGKRVGIYDETQRLAWLARKAEKHGFDVMEAGVRSDGKQRGRTGSGFGTVHSAAIFDGILRVNDAEVFLWTLENGIGSAKGFGFGLLSVAPIKR